MKVAVSIPDPVFYRAEQLAKRLGTSRSQLYARALDAFVDQNDPDRITERINEALDGVDQSDDIAWARQASRKVFERTEW